MKNNFLKIAGYLSISFFVMLLIIYSFFLYIGKSNIITTALFYVCLGLLGRFVFNALHRHKFMSQNSHLNGNLLLISTLIGLFALELFLKYGLKHQLTYPEKNGYFSTQSAYRQFVVKNIAKNKICHEQNCHIFNSRPNILKQDKNYEFSYNRKYNAIGFRDTEPPKKEGCTKLILALGDSFTEGVGAHQDSTWLKLMEYNLNANHKGQPICTMNGGIGGSDPLFEYATFTDLLSQFNPDVLILNINKSDIPDIVVRGGMERFKPNGYVQYRKAPFLDWFCQFSFICRHITHDLLKLNDFYYSMYDYEKEVTKAKNIIYQCIQDFSKLAEARHFNLVVVLHPYLHEFRNPFLLDDLFLKLSADTSFITINLRDEMMNTPLLQENIENAQALYWPIDLHNNPAGYRLWGQIMADCLVDYSLVNTDTTNDLQAANK